MKTSAHILLLTLAAACTGDDEDGSTSASTGETTSTSSTASTSSGSSTTGSSTGGDTTGDTGTTSTSTTGDTGDTTAETTGTDTGTAGGVDCETCIMTACAGPYDACVADETCACWLDCLMQPGTDEATCTANCGDAPPLLFELGSCMTANCADACQ